MKKRASALAVAMALSAGSALAADLPSTKAPLYIPPPPAPMWTGFYAGLNAGYGWGTDSSVTTASGAAADVWNTRYGYLPRANGVGSTFLGATALANATITNFTQVGFIGGAQFGYNWQYGSNFVFGIETDIQGAGIRGSGSSVGVSPSSTFTNYYDHPALYAIGVNNIDAGIDFMGTLRGRLGYLFNPTLLIYATGGLTYGGVHANANNQLAAATLAYPYGYNYGMPTFAQGGNVNQINVGWNIGGGFEWMFMPNWSLKAEALYYDLGSVNVAGLTGIRDGDCYGYCGPNGNAITNINLQSTRVSYQGVIARAGINYHFGWFAPAPVLAADLPSHKGPVVLPPPPATWTGFYAGLNAGYAFGTNDGATTQSGAAADAWNTAYGYGLSAFPGATALANATITNFTQSGFIGGAQFGYNWQYGSNIVVGLETDIQGAGISGDGWSVGVGPGSYTKSCCNPFTLNTVGVNQIQSGVNWMGTLRGRLGYLFTPALLVYATGGLTYGGVYANANSQLAAATGTFQNGYNYGMPTFAQGGNVNQINVGWNIGGGVEWMFMPNWSLKAEALYYDLGSVNVAGLTGIRDGDDYGRCPHGNCVTNINLQSTRVSYQGVIARAGINYHFGWFAPAPVLAKY